MVKCPYCKEVNTTKKWMDNTSLVVCGEILEGATGNPEKDNDPNYFYICPSCDKQVHGHEVIKEGK